MTQDIFQIIKRNAADFVQVNLSNTNSNQVLFENQKIKDFSKVFSTSVSVSVWIGKKHGIATAPFFSMDLVNKAIKIAKISENLDFFYGLPREKKIPSVKGLYGGEKTEEEIIDSAESLIIKMKKGESMPEAVFEYSTSESRLVNSLGLDIEEKSSLFGSSIEYLLKDKEVISYGDGLNLRKIPQKNKIADFSNRVLNETRELKNPVKLKIFPDVVILSYNALAGLLGSVFLSNLNGLNVLKKRSILEGKEGERLFSDNFNLTDSGLLEGGVGSQNFDGEGTPSQKTCLIKEGILRSFIYDYNTAKHLNKKSTGNSAGGGIGHNNVIIGKGEGVDEDRALIVKDIIGAHTGNDVTTEFSVESMGALLLDKGQKRAVKDIMINGRMIDLLKNIAGVDKKIMNVGNIYLPQIAFRGIKVENL